MATEPLQAAPYPVGTDAPDGPAQIQALALWARTRVVQVYASAAARSAAFTAAGISPTEGQVSYLQDVDELDQHDGTAWVPLTEGGAWTALTLPSGYSSLAPYPVPAYRKVRNRVWLRGACNVAASNAAGTKFTLPAGFRPTAGTVALQALMSNGTAGGGLRYDVGTSGNVNTLAATPAATQFVSFEGLSFPLD